MNPFAFVTRPVKDLANAILLPFKALWVVGITGFINWMTYSGHWWFKWVAFGMAIAVLTTAALEGGIVLARAARDIGPLDAVHRQLRGLLEAR